MKTLRNARIVVADFRSEAEMRGAIMNDKPYEKPTLFIQLFFWLLCAALVTGVTPAEAQGIGQATSNPNMQSPVSSDRYPDPRVSYTVTPAYSTLRSDIPIGSPDPNHGEISAVAMPKGGPCSMDGPKHLSSARLISSAGYESGTIHFAPDSYVHQDLADDFSPKGSSFSIAPRFNAAIASAKPPYYPVTDNQFVRTANGDLLAARMAYVDGNVAPYWNGKSGARVGLLTIRSKDCGDTWEYNGFLDPARVTLTVGGKDYSGAGAYPQVAWKDDTKKATVVIQGGGDRPEVYADPFDPQALYATLWFGGNDDRTTGTAHDKAVPSIVNTLLMSSSDAGKTWGTRPVMMLDGVLVPMAMTTTRAGRLFLFHCVSGVPTLHMVKDGKPAGQFKIFYGDATKPENACADTLDKTETPALTSPGYLNRVLRDVGISRVEGSGAVDIVRVVYPAVEAGRRVARVVVVKIQELQRVSLVSLLYQHTIAASDPHGNVLYPTFIETDRVNLPKSSKINTAVLYWYETAPVAMMTTEAQSKPSVRLLTRYSVFSESIATGRDVPGGSLSVARDLSLTDGKRRTWSPAAAEFVGDYMRGAFAYDGKLRFIAQWPERQPGENLRIRYNVITVEP